MKVCIAWAGGMRQCDACRSSHAGAAVMLHVRRTFSCTGISTYDARSRLSYAARWDCPCAPGLAMAAGLDISRSCHSQFRRTSTSAECGSISCGSDFADTTESSPEVRINLQRSCSSLPRATSRSRLCGGLLSNTANLRVQRSMADAVEMQETMRKTQRRKRRVGAKFEIFGQVCSPVLLMKLL